MALRFRRDADPHPRSSGQGTQADPFEAPPASRASSKVALLFAVLMLAAIGLAIGYERASGDHFYPHTRIGGLQVGSLTVDEAEAKVRDHFIAPLREPMTLTAPEFSATARPWDMGLRVRVSDTVRDALVRQQAKGIGFRLWYRIVGDATNVKLRPAVNEAVFSTFLSKTFSKIDQLPRDARLDISNDELKVIKHRLGRKVDTQRAEGAIFAALQAGERDVEVPVTIVEPTLKADAFKRVILIKTGSNHLTLYRNGKVSKRYRVATGTGGYPTPHGQFQVTAKRMNPTWYNPQSDWSRSMPAFIPPGPSNPLGTRALNLSASGIRIHGTPDAWSIGTNASHGCIRMHMADVEELFELVEVGTPVLVTS